MYFQEVPDEAVPVPGCGIGADPTGERWRAFIILRKRGILRERDEQAVIKRVIDAYLVGRKS